MRPSTWPCCVASFDVDSLVDALYSVGIFAYVSACQCIYVMPYSGYMDLG